ncbi:MAG TPA: hypothetical protein VHB46_04915 [Burkholderiales bacterium]|nr:hypothetical protein [Burkholderiales bacterium]
MKKILLAVALIMGLVATSAEAGRGYGWGGYHGGYHGGYYHSGWHGGYWWWTAPLIVGAAIAWPYYYSRSYAPSYYYPQQTTVYVQNPPTYVVANQPSYQAQSNGVQELGPATGAPPQISNAAPATVSPAPPPQPVAGRWFVYPSKGQSDAQLASDQTECGDWATKRSGYDPDMRYNNHPPSALSDYGRAMSACLEGRGYTVR